jgi:hypothetical protein
MVSLQDLLVLVSQLITVERKIEEALATEKDKARRKKLAKAIEKRDLAAIRDLLFDTY